MGPISLKSLQYESRSRSPIPHDRLMNPHPTDFRAGGHSSRRTSVTEKPRALTMLAQEASELRAKVRELPHQLDAAREFQALWDQFVTRYRPLVEAQDGRPWNPADPRMAAEVAAVDDLRLNLENRQSTQLPAHRDPLSEILRTSLRVTRGELYELFGPLERHGVVQHSVLNLARFDAQVAEARSDIIRYKRELQDELRRESARLAEMENAIPRLAWGMVRNVLWRTTWQKAVTTVGALLLAWLTPPVRRAALAAWAWIRSQF